MKHFDEKDAIRVTESLANTIFVDVTIEEVHRGINKEIFTKVTTTRRKAASTATRRVVINLAEFIPNKDGECLFALYGKGNELQCDDGGTVFFGNLYIRTRVLAHDVYRLDSATFPNDLFTTLHVSLSDYFHGRFFALPHPSGSGSILVEYIGGKSIHIEKGGGIRGKGDIYVRFEVDLPDLSGHTEDQRREARMSLGENLMS